MGINAVLWKTLSLACKLGVLAVQNEATCALPKIITTGFKSIQLIYFFTAGEDEVKCWQIRKGTKAPQVGNKTIPLFISDRKTLFSYLGNPCCKGLCLSIWLSSGVICLAA